MKAQEAVQPLEIRRMPHCAKLLLRGRSGDENFVAAVEQLTGISPPRRANSSAGERPSLLWMSPTGWLLLGLPMSQIETITLGLRTRLQDRSGDAINVSDEYDHIVIEGPTSVDLMATCCPLDLSQNAFPQGSVARTLAVGVPVTAHRPNGESAIHLYVDRSHCHYANDALRAQAREFA